jgi:flagellar biosynthetic protein FliQ
MISQAEIATVMQDAIFTVIVTAAPMLLAALFVGLIVSIFQATTQINEQTIAFVPKILAILLALLIFSGWIINHLSEFTTRLYQSIITYLG